jgi:hypothetical protein
MRKVGIEGDRVSRLQALRDSLYAERDRAPQDVHELLPKVAIDPTGLMQFHEGLRRDASGQFGFKNGREERLKLQASKPLSFRLVVYVDRVVVFDRPLIGGFLLGHAPPKLRPSLDGAVQRFPNGAKHLIGEQADGRSDLFESLSVAWETLFQSDYGKTGYTGQFGDLPSGHAEILSTLSDSKPRELKVDF